jgi:hypothetical protein
MPEDLNAEIAETLAVEDVRPERQRSPGRMPPARSSRRSSSRSSRSRPPGAGTRRRAGTGAREELYGRPSTIRNEADQALTLGGQQRLLDVSTFNTWIQARNDPFSNPDAPPGPSFMPEYVNPLLEQAPS